MSIVLTRIDDRLVHGQVVVGWVQSLQINHIIICSDSIAESEWEKCLYSDSVPQELKISFFSEKEFIGTVKKSVFENGRIIILVESPDVLERLVKGGVNFPEINIGGMHFKENSKEILPYVFLTEKDRDALQFLQSQNITITCQDTPAAKKHLLINLLGKVEK